MANLYGVANPNPTPVYANCIGGADVACPSGIETNVMQFAVPPALDNGFYCPFITVRMMISLGATPPTGVFIAIRINNGADLTGESIYQPTLVANANIAFAFTWIHNGAVIQNPFAAYNFQVSVDPVAQAVTCRQQGSSGWALWWRMPDQ